MIPLAGLRPARLLLQTEFLDKRVVATLIVYLQVAQMIAAIGDHLKQTAARMKILRILLEMLRKLVYLFREKRDLNIG